MSDARIRELEPRGGMSGTGVSTGDGEPWFMYFWPVFIAVLMGISIAASLLSVVVAYRHADEDVRVVSPPR